jgi:aminoglycoside/choline kinase family phosphotransferase
VKEISISNQTIAWCETALSQTNERVINTTPLRVEASHRSFYRIQTNRRSLVLMDSPPSLERNTQFTILAQVFHEQGLAVPEILAQEDELGLFLLTDLGSTHLEDLYGSAKQEAALAAAIDALPILAAISHPAVEPYSADRLHMEIGIFTEWFLEGLLQYPVERTQLQTISELLVSTAQLQPKGCLHRDYHCRNLLYDNGRFGIVEFLDALHGPFLYDIAYLMRDCYFEFS